MLKTQTPRIKFVSEFLHVYRVYLKCLDKFWEQVNHTKTSKTSITIFVCKQFFFVVKGPVADATDAQQPCGLLCNPVKIRFFPPVFPWNGAPVEWIWQGKLKHSGGKNLSQCHYVHHKSHTDSANSFLGTAPTFAWPQSFIFLSVGTIKTLVYSAPIEYEETLHHRICYVCQTIRNGPGTFKWARKLMIRRVHSCIDWRGGYFEHLLWTAPW
jgi:hypothetical protein